MSKATPLLRVSQAATLLGVSRYTLRDWCRNGRSPVPFVTLPSGHLRFHRDDLTAFVAERTTEAQDVNK